MRDEDRYMWTVENIQVTPHRNKMQVGGTFARSCVTTTLAIAAAAAAAASGWREGFFGRGLGAAPRSRECVHSCILPTLLLMAVLVLHKPKGRLVPECRKRGIRPAGH
jgi:hypothetical protein